MSRLIEGYDIKRVINCCYLEYRFHKNTLDQENIAILYEIYKTNNEFIKTLWQYDTEFVSKVMKAVTEITE